MFAENFDMFERDEMLNRNNFKAKAGIVDEIFS
jgi:hypothetical protein